MSLSVRSRVGVWSAFATPQACMVAEIRLPACVEMSPADFRKGLNPTMLLGSERSRSTISRLDTRWEQKFSTSRYKLPCGSIRQKPCWLWMSERIIDSRNLLLPEPDEPMTCMCVSRSLPESSTGFPDALCPKSNLLIAAAHAQSLPAPVARAGHSVLLPVFLHP